MNNKAALGLVAAIIILVGAFFILNRPVTTPVNLTQTATSTMATSTKPTSLGTPIAPVASPHGPSPQPKRVTAFDALTLTSNAPRPVVTGTANVMEVAMVLDDPNGVGIEGVSHIPVVKGHWFFVPTQMLPPGTYTLHLVGGDMTVVTKLYILQS